MNDMPPLQHKYPDNEALEFMHEYCDFSDPNCVWVMKGISRNKDNPDNPYMDRFLRRMIVTVPDDIDDCYDEIHSLANDPDTKYRIYMSLNSRDVVDAAFQFQKKLVDITQGLAKGHNDALQMAKKVGSMWKTALEQRHARGTKRILLDIDNCDLPPTHVVAYLRNVIITPVHCMRQTVSGWAVVADACDTRGLLHQCKTQWGLEVDLQRDSMLFIEQF
jgi:hypothetical protein